DLGQDGRSSRATPCTPVVFLCDQYPVPRQQRVRRHNRGEVPQNAASECLGFRRQPTALSVGEAHTSGPQLFPQDTVLFVEVVDDIALLLAHPTGERDENETQRVWQRRHSVKATRGWFIGCLRLPDLKSNPLSKISTGLGRRSGCWTIRDGRRRLVQTPPPAGAATTAEARRTSLAETRS